MSIAVNLKCSKQHKAPQQNQISIGGNMDFSIENVSTLAKELKSEVGLKAVKDQQTAYANFVKTTAALVEWFQANKARPIFPPNQP
jgi:hypothetical protein